jgi:hypothetical protein
MLKMISVEDGVRCAVVQEPWIVVVGESGRTRVYEMNSRTRAVEMRGLGGKLEVRSLEDGTDGRGSLCVGQCLKDGGGSLCLRLLLWRGLLRIH